MRFRLLGPVAAFTETEQLELPAHRPRVLLAALLLRANQTVPIGELIDMLWDTDLPSRPRAALQVYVSRLRTALGDTDRSLIRTTQSGYSLTIDPDRIDLTTFRQLVDRAANAQSPATRAELLGEALALWQGEPLAGLDTSVLTREVAPRLREERLRAIELELEARLASGDHFTALPQLMELVEQHPTREHFWAQLMRAQHASGREAAALATYSEVSRRLADLLGTGPGPELQKVHQDLLEASEPGSLVIPHQLPVGVRTFTGREDDLTRLDRLLGTAPVGGSGGAASASSGGLAGRVGLVIGAAGIGKTTLAVHWARRAADRFPDGVLYADLRGFAPSVEPADPGAVLNHFLVGVGLPADRIPEELDEQVALFRSVLANRSILVLLDNARSTEQVRPLLATGSRCLTLVTSRNELGGLVAAEQAEPFRLELLSPDQGTMLLTARIGAKRLQQDPAAAAELVEGCAGLPLALSLVAAQIELRPRLPLATHVRALRQTPLDALSRGETGCMRAIFSWSYRELSPESARLFRLLGRHPGPDLTVEAAAALAGVPVATADRMMGELASSHQLSETAAGCYAMHDLLRTYAIELCGDDEAEQALRRLLDYLVHAGRTAAMALSPTRDPIELPAPDPRLELAAEFDREQAFEWFDRHQGNHFAVLDAAAGSADEQLWQYAWCYSDYLDHSGRWTTWLESQTLAFQAAIRLCDRIRQAQSRRSLARVYLRLRRWDEAVRQHELALGLAEELGDDQGLAHGHLGIARVLNRLQRQHEAIEHTARALAIYERIGHRSGAANALNNIGWYYAVLEKYDLALDHCGRALKMFRDLGEPEGEADALDSIGHALAGLGRLDEAITSHRAAVELANALGRQYETAQCLVALGDTQEMAGDRTGARVSWQRAATILDALDHPDAAALHAKLA